MNYYMFWLLLNEPLDQSGRRFSLPEAPCASRLSFAPYTQWRQARGISGRQAGTASMIPSQSVGTSRVIRRPAAASRARYSFVVRS